MKIFKSIIALIITLSMAWCFDLIMTHVSGDISGFGKFAQSVGRFAIGWFFFGDIVFPHINKKLEE